MPNIRLSISTRKTNWAEVSSRRFSSAKKRSSSCSLDIPNTTSTSFTKECQFFGYLAATCCHPKKPNTCGPKCSTCSYSKSYSKSAKDGSNDRMAIPTLYQNALRSEGRGSTLSASGSHWDFSALMVEAGRYVLVLASVTAPFSGAGGG